MIWYQDLPQLINPVAVSLGVVEIRWYALAWIGAMMMMWWLLIVRVRRGEGLNMQVGDVGDANNVVDDMVLWGLVGGLVGGRLGYAIVYDWAHTIAQPLSLIMPVSSTGNWIGISGMSFHGGLIGVACSFWWVSRRYNLHPFMVSDFIVPVLPIISLIGRIGNFINHELYGRVTQVSWGMHFVSSGDEAGILRHPSQIYEAILEGFILLLVLWFLRNRWYMGSGVLTAIYLIGYGVARFIVEFWRLPDAQIGFVWMELTIGQIFSGSMIIAGFGILVYIWYTNNIGNVKHRGMRKKV